MKTKILITLLIFPCSFILSQTLDKNFPSTDNTINATLLSGDTLYIGGDFTYTYNPARGLARFVNGSLKPDVTYPQLGGGDYIQAVEPDGVGGLYLAGYFDTYNGIALPNTTAIIHLLEDGKLDQAFGRVDDNNGYTISALKRKGSRLYIGGTFTSANIPGRTYFAALDAFSGALLPWIPDFPDSYVNRIDATDSLVFIGGSFANVGNIPNNYFAALHASNGRVIKNFPRSDYNYTNSFAVDGNSLYVAGPFTVIQNTVRYLLKADTTSGGLDLNYPFTDGYIYTIFNDGVGGYYIGGNFTKVGKENRTNLAHILSDGTVDTAFNPNLNGPVNCITASADTLYFGGSFTIVNAKTRNNVAAVSRTKGILANWNPNANAAVNTIALFGNTIYLGGYFTKLGVPTRNYAGAIGINNVLSTTWIPNPDSYVNSLVVNSSGSAIYLGGNFSSVKSQPRSYVAKVNAVNGDPLAWYPQPNSSVFCMALNGKNIYLGGTFSTINSIQRNNLAAVDTSTSLLNNFQADANGPVRDIKFYNGKMYVAGDFTTIQNLVRTYAARFSIETGIADNWLNGAKVNSYIYALGCNNLGVILGGQFTSYNPVPRPYIAAIDLNQPNYPLLSWIPNVFWTSFSTMNGFIHNGNDLIFGGSFVYQENGKSISNLIILNDSTGIISKSISQYPNNTIKHLAVYNNTLSLSGDFTGFSNVSDGTPYSNVGYLCSYDLTTLQASKNNYYPDNSILKIFTDANDRLIVAGSFTRMNYINRNRIAAININTGLVTDFNPSADGSVYTLALKDTVLFAGGAFGNLNTNNTPVVRSYLGAVSTKTGKATTWNANANNSIYTLAVKDTILYAGGTFTTFKGAARNYGAAVTTSGTGTVNGWAPNPNSYIWTILPHNNTLFIGGDFTTVKGVSVGYLAQVNNSNGTPNSWNPSLNSSVYTFDRIGNKFYAGGNFTSIGVTPRNSLASFDTATKALTPFDANLNSSASIQSIVSWGKNLIVRGQNLSSINGDARQYIGTIDSVTKLATPFNPQPNYAAYVGAKFVIGKNKLFYGSGFTTLYNNPISPNYLGVFNLEPLNQVSGLVFSNLTPTSVKATVTKGSGDGRIFVVRRGNTLPNAPVDSMWYRWNTRFGSGDKIGDSSYALYAGSLDSVTAILLPNKKYQFAVFEFNGSGPGADYLITPAVTGSVTTPCPTYNLKTTPADSVRICPGTLAAVSAPAGFSTYLWNTGENTLSVNKPAGNYTVQFIDSNGCSGSAAISIFSHIKPNVGRDTVVRVCGGLAANLTNLYNTSGYTTVIWSTPRPDSAVVGNYTLIVSNTTGCTDTALVRVDSIPRYVITATTSSTNAGCFGSSMGSITVNPTNGLAPYKYKNGLAGTFQNSNLIKPLTAGTYTIYIVDSNKCSGSTSPVTITQFASITATFTKTNATCIGRADGTITINATGGKPPYKYRVGTSGIYRDGSLITGLAAGTYTIYIRDIAGCTGSVGPIVVSQNNVSCLQMTGGGIKASATNQNLQVTLSPNPSVNVFSLYVYSKNRNKVQIRVLDINGKIKYETVGLAERLFRFGENLNAGIYLVEVRQGDEILTIKAIKSR